MPDPDCGYGNLPRRAIDVSRAFVIPKPVDVRATSGVRILQSFADNNSAVQEYEFERLVRFPLWIRSNSLARDDLFPRNPLSEFRPCGCFEVLEIGVHYRARFAFHNLFQGFLRASRGFSTPSAARKSGEPRSGIYKSCLIG